MVLEILVASETLGVSEVVSETLVTLEVFSETLLTSQTREMSGRLWTTLVVS